MQLSVVGVYVGGQSTRRGEKSLLVAQIFRQVLMHRKEVHNNDTTTIR